MLKPDLIASSCNVPPSRVQSAWPLILASLNECGIADLPTQIAAAATVAVETSYTFLPLEEKCNASEGAAAYFKRMYWSNPKVAHMLGNLNAKDAIRFHGRGYIQLTGRDNYELYAGLIGEPIDENPDLLLQPAVSAKVLAWFFKRHDISHAAQGGDWKRVRIRVNGGLNGWEPFIGCVNKMTKGAS